MDKEQTFESSSGETGTTSAEEGFIALMGEVLKQSLGGLLDLGGKILEEKEGGFNLSCVDPEVGRKREV